MLPLGAEDLGGVLAGLRTRVLADRGAGLKTEDVAAKYAASSMGRIVLDSLAVHRQPDACCHRLGDVIVIDAQQTTEFAGVPVRAASRALDAPTECAPP